MSAPLSRMLDGLRRTALTRFFGRMFDEFPDLHMKDLTVEAAGPDRRVKIDGRWVTNFGSDSFLGLDRDPRVWAAIERGLQAWGSHNGASRAFSSVAANVEAEAKLARWMGTERTLIYPSVTLANMGAIPALVTRHDVIATDQYAHNSVQEGARLAQSRGTRVGRFAHNDPDDLARVLAGMRPYRHAVVAVDGVYSMSGDLPPLRELHRTATAADAVLYVDDAHGTGVLGAQGRGTVLDALGSYENVLVVGSLSKAFSAAGGFIAAPAEAELVLKVRSNPLIFGGPVPPPYLEAVSTVADILMSDEYPVLQGRLDANKRRFVAGCRDLGLGVLGGLTPIVSVSVGDEIATLRHGRFLFERGYYVQSVVFPAVPHRAGVLRVQLNANHSAESVEGLVGAFAELAPRLPKAGPATLPLRPAADVPSQRAA